MTNAHKPHPDIEIYLAGVPAAALIQWLTSRFGQPMIDHQGKRELRGSVRYRDVTVPFMVIEKAAQQFSSLWLDSAATPWPTDLQCAQEAAEHFDVEVRCIVSSWQEGDEPNEWWSVQKGTEPTLIQWL